MEGSSAPDLQAVNSNHALSDTNYNSQNLDQNSKENMVYSLSKYREIKRLKDIELIQKKHQNEITNLIKSELEKQLIEYKANKEMEELDKELEDLNYRSIDNNKYLFSVESKRKEKEKVREKEEEAKKKNNESKNNKKEKNSTGKIRISEEAKINQKNLHENPYLIEQAKKRQLFEINQLKNQKRLERLEKLNIIRNEQLALKKRLESERVNKNLKRNNDNLIIRKKYIENKIQYKDLNIFENKKRKDEERNKEFREKDSEEKARRDYIKKLRLSEEKYRENFYNDLVKKDYKLKQKMSKNLESNEKPFILINEMNKLRTDNLNKLQALIKNGIDENNIKDFYSEFPENKDIIKVFENYQKQKKIIEIDSFRKKEKKRLNPIKPENSVKRYKTTYDSKNKTKYYIDSKNTESKPVEKENNKIKNDNKNQQININKNNKNKINIIPNICSTKKEFKYNNKDNNKDNINNNNANQEIKEEIESKVNINNNIKLEDNKKDVNTQINNDINNKDKDKENKDNNILIEKNIIIDNNNIINNKEGIITDNKNDKNNNNDRSSLHYDGYKNETHENYDEIDENNNLNIPNNEIDNQDKRNILKDKKKVLFETEIREKINEYRKTRYQPFMEMLEKEKINEENRNMKLENITNSDEKRQLENLFGKERTVVSLRLKKENEKILRDIQKYEDNIRLENQQNQKYNMDRIKIKK